MSDSPQISRRSFLRSSSAVTAATILVGLPSVSVQATPGKPLPPSVPGSGATVVIPQVVNSTSVARTYTYTITWTYPDGSTSTDTRTFTLQPQGQRDQESVTNPDAVKGKVEGGESPLLPPVNPP